MKRIQLFFDIVLNRIFNGGTYSIVRTHPNNKPAEIHYERFPSVRIGAYYDNHFNIGGYGDVVYTFDEKGKILSRRRLKDIFSEKANLVIGDWLVGQAHREYQASENFWNSVRNLPGETNIG